MKHSRHRALKITSPLLALFLISGCGDISRSQLEKMDRDVQCVLDPSVDGNAFLAKNPQFNEFAENIKKTLGTFKKEGASLIVDREANIAKRTYWGSYEYKKVGAHSKGSATIEARFKLEGESWVLTGVEVVSPKISSIDSGPDKPEK